MIERKFISKRDLDDAIFGIEAYLPGDPGVGQYVVSISSGTTGGNGPIILLKKLEPATRTMRQAWLSAETPRRILRLSSSPSLELRITRPELSQENTEILTLDHHDLEAEDAIRLITEFRPTALEIVGNLFERFAARCGTPAIARALAEVRSLRYAGEPLTERVVKKLRAILPAAEIYAGYSSSELHAVALSCPALAARHPEDSFSYFHPKKKILICDTDASGVGEIAGELSAETNIWYRTGDLGLLTEEICSCGETHSLRLLGRKDHDRITVLGAVFIRSSVEAILDPFLGETIADYQLEVGEKEIETDSVRGFARLSIVPAKKERSPQSLLDIGDHLSERLYITPSRTLAELVRERIFLPLEVRFLPELPQALKTIRLRRLLEG